MVNWKSERVIELGQLLFLALVSFMSYSSVIYVSFSYDDVPLIIENPYLRSWSGLWTLLQSGRPVRGISFWLDYQIWGLEPRGFHFTNLLLNIFCVLSAFYLVRIVFLNSRLAFLSALLYALHPINTEAVVNVAHRKELFCFLFMVLSLLAFKRSKSRPFFLFFSLVFYLLALLSKQVALVLPLLLFLDAYLSPKATVQSWKRAGFWSGIYLLIPILAFLFSLSDFNLFGRFQPADFYEKEYLSILATQFKYFPKYLWLSFFPAHLNVDHYIEYAESFFELKVLGGLFLFIFSLALLIYLCVKRVHSGFAWAWLILNLLPLMNFIPSNQIFSERYLYIPVLGSVILVGLGLEKFGQSIVKYLGSKGSRGFWFLFGLNLVFLTVYFAGFMYGQWGKLWRGLPELDLNLGRIFISGAILVSLPVSIIWFYWNQFNHQKRFSLYKDLLFFVLSLILGTLLYVVIITYLVYQRWIIPYPDLTIHQSYLSGLAKVAKPESSHFNLASRLLPSGTIYSEIIYTFIFVFLLWGIFIGLLNYWGRKLAEQKSSLFGIILVGPFLMLLMFAQTRIRTHAWGSEASIWKATIRENPLSFLGWNNLGRAYIQRGKLKEALPCFVMAHSLKPDLLEPILNLGNTLLKAGELDFAQHYYEWALKINPYSFIARLNLANCLATKQEYHQAVENYLEVLKLKPDSFEATYNLALCFLGLGDRARAQFYLLKTLRLAPEHQPSQILLEQLRKVPP